MQRANTEGRPCPENSIQMSDLHCRAAASRMPHVSGGGWEGWCQLESNRAYFFPLDVGRIGRTFQSSQKLRKNYEIDFDAEGLSFTAEEEPALPSTTTKKAELSYNEVKDARWFHDTPGIIRDGCVRISSVYKEFHMWETEAGPYLSPSLRAENKAAFVPNIIFIECTICA